MLTLEKLKAMFALAAKVITENEEYLSKLDAACGDGDHGVAIKGAINAANDAIQAGMDLKSTLFDAGFAAMSHSNGSTSSIYGSLLMGVSDGIKDGAESLSAQELASAFKTGLESMRSTVKGDVGDKTVFDALIPAIEAMQGANSVLEALEKASNAAKEGAQNTAKLQAKFGRARNLGEKSIGTLDPGAVSNSMIFEAFFNAYK
ncbi:DAK2 domain-containing protein [Intestinicryptomonas porci]|uniref:DAK2 domain-containing protein n=1 Tax=Intestinicryptomonas porci TaxID=2926320 RepID=A0ABU4WFQ6_9BACT|nr:DAK2 domain-containing protein [Opitutales bacterium CLA-KB-P66]